MNKNEQIIEQILLKQTFTLELKPTPLPRLRRLPRGNRCPIDTWHTHTTYKLDTTRTTSKYLLFNAIEHQHLLPASHQLLPTSQHSHHIYQQPIQVNWWINTETKQICYDASSSIKPYVVKDKLSDFIFTFTPTNNFKPISNL